jgi:hypothetical protein
MSQWLLPDSEDDSELLQAHFFPRREARIPAITSLISTKFLLPQSPKQREVRIVEGTTLCQVVPFLEPIHCAKSFAFPEFCDSGNILTYKGWLPHLFFYDISDIL